MSAINKLHANVPHELKQLEQWVCWQSMARTSGKKPTKVPINPKNLLLAKTNDPGSWSSYDIAIASFEKNSHLSGVGFVFTDTDSYMGVDLDHCIDTSTGSIEPWAQNIINKCGSYTEISPSGTGVHIVMEGKLPKGRRRKGNIEMYDSGRYFTMTGDAI